MKRCEFWSIVGFNTLLVIVMALNMLLDNGFSTDGWMQVEIVEGIILMITVVAVFAVSQYILYPSHLYLSCRQLEQHPML